MKKFFLILFSFLFFFTACEKENDKLIPEPFDTVCDYLYLGHIYENPNTIDPRVENADLEKYAQIWLGGDICSETTQEEATLDYLDNIFDLSSKKTHWSVGNHDIRNGNTQWITDRTGRDLYYSEFNAGITYLVLNTVYYDADDCPNLERQVELIKSVCDTISESSHLIILMHNIVWGNLNGVGDAGEFANANFSWILFNCSPPAKFEAVVYPELIKVQERGVKVICIAGDMGQAASTYEFTSDEGIVFLASGITSETEYNERWPTFGQRDSVLILTHDLINKNLIWRFIDIDEI